MAMNVLGLGLNDAKHYEDALSVQEAELSTKRRLGAQEESILVTQDNLANTYQMLSRFDEALRLRQEVYSGRLKLDGEERRSTLVAANNYASTLGSLGHLKEVKAVMRRTLPVAKRVIGKNDETTLRMQWAYARALYEDPAATLDDLREAVETTDETERIARRVLGGAHPLTAAIEDALQNARATLRAREETPSS
jgi:hypothetical protein